MIDVKSSTELMLSVSNKKLLYLLKSKREKI